MASDTLSTGIGYIYQDEYPWDIRADKITGSLADAGFNTVIISRNRSRLPVLETLQPKLEVYRLPAVSMKPIRDLLNVPAFFSPVWLWAIYRAVKSRQLGLLIVRDLPLSPAAWLIGKICKIPVIMDMAENYPAMIQDTWDHRGPRFQDYLMRNPVILRAQEKWVMPRLDGVMAVSAASKKRVCAIPGVRHDNVWVIENTPKLDKAGAILDCELSRKMQSMRELKLLYVGGLEESRGLMFVIDAVAKIVENNTPAVLVIVGEGTSRKGLEHRAEQLGIGSRVIFPGWIDQAFVPGIIAAADVCIVPHLVTEHIETTVPNKIYDYMAQAKPVLVTHSPSLRQIVEQIECGMWYTDRNTDELASAITAMNDVELRKGMGERGKEAVERRLNWSVDAKHLVEIVTQITASKGDALNG